MLYEVYIPSIGFFLGSCGSDGMLCIKVTKFRLACVFAYCSILS